MRLSGLAVLARMRRAVVIMSAARCDKTGRRLCVRGVVGIFGRHGGRRHCAGHQMSLDTLDVHCVREHDAEQQHGQAQYAQRTRRRTGPHDTRERPSRNHAVTLAAWRA
jgi:hypothetical protein